MSQECDAVTKKPKPANSILDALEEEENLKRGRYTLLHWMNCICAISINNLLPKLLYTT